jgi:pseudomonalisin
LRRIVIALTFLAVAATALAAPAVAGTGGGAEPSRLTRIRLAGNVLPSLDRLPSQQPDSNAQLEIGVVLDRDHVAAELEVLRRFATAGRGNDLPALSIREIVRRFGVPGSRTAAVRAWLTDGGLDVESVAPTGDYISARGTVAQVERVFAVKERLFTAPDGIRFFANDRPPLVPSDARVATVVGLNTLQRYTLPRRQVARTGSKPAQDGCQQTTCVGTTTPQDLWQVYEQPPSQQGQGVGMAIIGAGYPYYLKNYLRRHEAKYRLPAIPLTIHCVQQHDCGVDQLGELEWQIDTQAAGSMAPQASGEDLYFAKSLLDADLNNAFIAWATDEHGPDLASASVGECEASPANGVVTGPLGPLNSNASRGPQAVLAFGNGEQAALEPMLRVAALAGKTLFAPTGDTGSSCPLVSLPLVGTGNGAVNQAFPEQNYPAVSTYAVAVGGTVLYTHDNASGAGDGYRPGSTRTTRVAEYAWPFGGGGASPYLPAAPWQRPVLQATQPCVISPAGSPAVAGQQCRGVPDVAALSGDVLGNGFSIYGPGGFTTGSGTSLSAPLWMGMWARVQGAAHRALGFAPPLLYGVGTGAASYGRDFYDITVGGNGLHVAAPGWDYTTGLGVPRMSGLIRDLSGP